MATFTTATTESVDDDKPGTIDLHLTTVKHRLKPEAEDVTVKAKYGILLTWTDIINYQELAKNGSGGQHYRPAPQCIEFPKPLTPQTSLPITMDHFKASARFWKTNLQIFTLYLDLTKQALLP